jgi:hypothetical protein
MLDSCFSALLSIEPGSGIVSKSGGCVKGSFFFIKNSSVVLTFSFLKTLPASLKDEHPFKNKNAT